MNLISCALKGMIPKAKAFEKSTKDPAKTQRKLLFEFLIRNRNTEYGKKYNFSAVHSVAEYQQAVPLVNYEMLRPSIDRMIHNETGILTADNPLFFAITSGTTGQPKFIPVTKHSRSRKIAAMNLWLYYISRDHPSAFDGKILAIVSPEIEGETPSGIPYGSESGHGYRNLPAPLKTLCVLPYPIFKIEDYNARYYAILRIAMAHNVTTLAAMNPSTILLLCRKIKEWKDEIIEDIENGTLNQQLDIPPDIRKVLEKPLRPNPERASTLRRILKEKKELLPRHFWPDMELIECWKGGNAGLYLKSISPYFGSVQMRDFGYLSSEARGSIPISDNGAGGVLAIQTNFYEFIPKKEIDHPEKRVLLCNQLEVGGEYFIILTTPGGLYRYQIDDLVRIVGFFNKTPVIEFVQKGQNVTSITGEKLYESQVNEAVEIAAARHKLSLQFFTAAVQWDQTPRYIFLAEFTDQPAASEKRSFLKSIEIELRRINMEYENKRKSLRLDHPLLKIVERGGFEQYRARKIQEGSSDGQFKITQLTSDLDFQKNFSIIEEISMDSSGEKN